MNASFTVTHDRDWTWIHFPGKPAESVLASLRTFAKFSRRRVAWYITRGVGRHPNDRELSFYVMTPSGFELEIGWDALTVEESSWEAGRSYPNMSTWGHELPGRFSSELGISHVLQMLRSLAGREYLPW